MERSSQRFLTTVLMTDIVASTEHAAELGDAAWRELVQAHHAIVRSALRTHGGREVDTAGDGFFAVFDGPAAAVATAVEIRERVRAIGIEIRAGVHVGEVEEIAGKVGGLSVPIAARITGLAKAGEILVSGTVRDLAAGAGFAFQDRGVHLLKGVPGEWPVYAALPAGASEATGGAATTDAETMSARRAATIRHRRSRPLWQRRPRLVAVTTGVIAVIGLSAVLAVWRPWQAAALPSIPVNGVGVIDAGRNEIVGALDLGSRSGGIAVGDGEVWVAGTGSNTVIRIDLATRTVTREIDVGREPTGIAIADGSVWVTNRGDRTVTRISIATARVVDTVEVGNSPRAIAAGMGAVWVGIQGDSTVVRIDPTSGMPGPPIPVPGGPVGMAIDDTGLWVASTDGLSVSRLHPETGVALAAPVALAARPSAIAAGAGSVWVAGEDGSLTRIDAEAARVTSTIDIGGSPAGLAVDGTTIWIADRDGGVSRLDTTNPSTPSRRVTTTSAPEALAVAGDEVWVTTGASPSTHRGGTLRVLFTIYGGLDPTGPFPHNAARLQADGLVGYRRVGGAAGSALLPALATSLPEPTASGRTYTFQLRPGMVYNDGRPVLASDFRRAVERSFQVESPFGAVGGYLFAAIEGAEACVTPDSAPVPRCELGDGVEFDDEAGIVTFHLSRPDPDFLHKLAMPPAFPAPEGVPMNAPVDGAFPGTGPYIVESVTSNEIRFVRNEHFSVWDSDVRPDGYAGEIVYELVGMDLAPEERVRRITAGEADHAPLRGPNRLPPDQLAEISRRYAGQVHFGGSLMTFVLLDITKPPFDQLEARQALAMAIDRTAIVEAYGGSPAIRVTCQFLPPGWPGHVSYCPFTVDPDAGGGWRGPDLAAAHELVEASGTRGAEVVVGPTRIANAATRDEVARTLEALGYRVTVEEGGDDDEITAALREGRIQVGVFDVLPDILAPSTWFVDFSCPPGPEPGLACDEEVDTLYNAALELQPTDLAAAAQAWAEVERAVVDRATWIPLLHAGGDFVSERVGNVQFHPAYLVLHDQMWVR